MDDMPWLAGLGLALVGTYLFGGMLVLIVVAAAVSLVFAALSS